MRIHSDPDPDTDTDPDPKPWLIVFLLKQSCGSGFIEVGSGSIEPGSGSSLSSEPYPILDPDPGF
jgi:hypothetical protein